MYLKSLTLKGFKSFADKQIMTLEPGITAIVGPNGSGKSNICDAVLWVLGERNAKNLRGHAMEDVIFSGSSARRSISIAEVELVLDNSDATLPVDFNEVTVARRMYRTGESEYLINGASVRRMDVLDILHDSGLGQGTHSIISQGSIDSVLQSKPEERRTLIEEAAGVLKHKQRMARSSKKLERMNAHVERVLDITNEVERQLGPLERRAKRARSAKELNDKLSHARLLLSVDDLKNCQVRFNDVSAKCESLESKLAKKRSAIESLDEEMRELQSRIRQETEADGSLSAQQRRAQSALDKTDSVIALARDRRRAATNRASEIEVSIETNKSVISRLSEGLSKSEIDFKAATKAESEAQKLAKTLETSFDEFSTTEKRLKDKLQKITLELEQLELSEEEARRSRALAQETLTQGLAHMKILDVHVAELQSTLTKYETDFKNSESEALKIKEALKALEQEERESRNLMGACLKARDAARAAFDEASVSQQSLKAQLDALYSIEKRRDENSGDARLLSEKTLDELSLGKETLLSVIDVESAFEPITELLLGNDVDAFLLADEKPLKKIVSVLTAEKASGQTSFILSQSQNCNSEMENRLKEAKLAARVGKRELLVNHISCPNNIKPMLDVLLGDVVVCEDALDVIDAHKKFPNICLVSPDGTVAYPSGKVVLGLQVLEADQGVLARKRQITELENGLISAAQISEEAASKLNDAQNALEKAQIASLRLSERLAEMRGSAQSAQSLVEAASKKLKSATLELEEVLSERDIAAENVAKARPDMEKQSSLIEQISTDKEKAKSEQRDIRLELAPISQKVSDISNQLQSARLEVAKTSEKKNYVKLIVSRHSDDIAEKNRELNSLMATLKTNKGSEVRLGSLVDVLLVIENKVKVSLAQLEAASVSAASHTSGMHADLEKLRLSTTKEHNAFDDINKSLADARVEKARIEMQVESVVSEIIDKCHTSLETALSLPELEDRSALEEEAANLTRRIASLGTINPNAAKEYDELKSRYDYLSGQLSDLREASKALTRIDSMIESRMKDDFFTTYQEIDRNFQEIFSLLFPGGRAHLSLESPDDIENTGVEVHAQPAGKRISKMSLMSGGEKSLTALALLFALYRTRPTPFYILDEVEAALDDTNLRRLIKYIDNMRASTQLIMITHQRRTMEMADVLFGVSMQSDGVTKVVSQKLDRALQEAE